MEALTCYLDFIRKLAVPTGSGPKRSSPSSLPWNVDYCFSSWVLEIEHCWLKMPAAEVVKVQGKSDYNKEKLEKSFVAEMYFLLVQCDITL